MATENSTKHIFPFFRLPPEMRDMVYDQSLEDVNIQLPCKLTLEAVDVAPTNLLLISKQFQTELQDRAKKHSHLTIKDQIALTYDPTPTADNSFYFGDATLPVPTTKIQHIKFEPNLDCLDGSLSTGQYISNLTAQMQYLKTFNVKMLGQMTKDSARSFDCVWNWASVFRDDTWWKVDSLQSFQIWDAGHEGRRGLEAVWNGTFQAKLAIEWKMVDDGSGVKKILETVHADVVQDEVWPED